MTSTALKLCSNGGLKLASDGMVLGCCDPCELSIDQERARIQSLPYLFDFIEYGMGRIQYHDIKDGEPFERYYDGRVAFYYAHYVNGVASYTLEYFDCRECEKKVIFRTSEYPENKYIFTPDKNICNTCSLCKENSSKNGYTETNYLEITGISCTDDCARTQPYVIGVYDQRSYTESHPDYKGCVWWEWTSEDCRTWYGVDHECVVYEICKQKVCEPFVAGCYRVVFNYDEYSTNTVEEKWEGMVRKCVLGSPYQGFIDPMYFFDSLAELFDYVDYVETSTDSSLHTITGGIGLGGSCALFVDGVETAEIRVDWKLNRYEPVSPDDPYYNECGHPNIPNNNRNAMNGEDEVQ